MGKPRAGSNEWFAEQYAQVADARLEVQRGSLGEADGAAEIYTYPRLPSRLSCREAACEGGAYFLEPFLDDAIRERRTLAEDVLWCDGHEDMGRGQTRICMGRCKVKSLLVYGDTEPEV